MTFWSKQMPALRNPVLLLVIGLPLLAVLGSFASLAVTLRHPDGELPEQYHWEGFQLDRDFSRSEHAAALNVCATLRNIAVAGPCEIDLWTSGPPPERLALTLAHATRAALDQHVEFHHVGRNTYAGDCAAIPDGHWRIELSDAAGTWSVRESVRGVLQPIQLDARTAEDD
jgi:hypothetical protein